MSTSLQFAIEGYVRAKNLAQGTRDEYLATINKWKAWGRGGVIENVGRKEVREFLDWVFERAVLDQGTNPGRTANKAREHLRAVMAWAWEQDLIESLPRFPQARPQRDVAGRHYLTKAELNAPYFATHDVAAAIGIHGAGQRNRGGVSLLSQAVSGGGVSARLPMLPTQPECSSTSSQEPARTLPRGLPRGAIVALRALPRRISLTGDRSSRPKWTLLAMSSPG